MRDKLFTLLKVTISLGLIVYLITRPEMAETGRVLISANYIVFAMALAVYFLAIVVNVYKWRLLLHAQGIDAPMSSLLAYFFSGLFFANFLLPMVASDLVRGYGLARDSQGRVAQAAISVLVDRLVGLASFIVAAVVMSAYAVFVLGRSDLSQLAWLAVLVFVAFAALFASLLSQRLRALIEHLFRLHGLSSLAPIYRQLSEAIQAYRCNYGVLFVAFAIALVGLLLTNAVNYLAAVAVRADIPLVYVFIFNPFSPFVGLVVPSAGGLGVNQGVYVGLYTVLGKVATAPAALSMSLLMQLIIYLASLPGGVLWWRARRVQPVGAR